VQTGRLFLWWNFEVEPDLRAGFPCPPSQPVQRPGSTPGESRGRPSATPLWWEGLYAPPTRSRRLIRKNISPLRIARDAKFFASRKYLCRAPPRASGVFQSENRAIALFFARSLHRHEAVTLLSIPKITENYQNQPLMYLTGYQAIPISCGQGSGHPHPVVVDNVSGSFGNLVSPGSFCRL